MLKLLKKERKKEVEEEGRRRQLGVKADRLLGLLPSSRLVVTTVQGLPCTVKFSALATSRRTRESSRKNEGDKSGLGRDEEMNAFDFCRLSLGVWRPRLDAFSFFLRLPWPRWSRNNTGAREGERSMDSGEVGVGGQDWNEVENKSESER